MLININNTSEKNMRLIKEINLGDTYKTGIIK